MMFHSLGCLRAWVLYSVVILSLVGVRRAAAQNQQSPQQQQPQQQPPPKPPNPFETVPLGQEEAPKPAQPAQPAQPSVAVPATPSAPRATLPGQPPANVIEAIEFRGARRVRQDTLQALIVSKKGDRLDEEVLHRDFIALWNSQRFDDLRIEREPGKEGFMISFVLV
jgi:outer membrane protein insertion porin family